MPTKGLLVTLSPVNGRTQEAWNPMRLTLVLLVLGALALSPGAAAMAPIGVDFAAHSPSEVEAGAPDQSLTIEGQGASAETEGTTGDAPIDASGSAGTKDATTTVQGPSCKVPTKLESRDEAARNCDTGSVDTNAGIDLVEIAVDVKLRESTAGDSEESVSTAAAVAQVADMPSAGTVLLAAAAASAGAGALYGLWRLLKWTGLAAVFPLYSHISDDQILDDPNRAGIYQLIQSEPGISTKDVADRLGLAWGTVTHHLNKLEKRRFVVSKKYGKYRRYFANGHGGTERKDEVATLRLDRTGDIAALIQARPGLTQKEVSELLGVSSSTILWHVKRLEKVDLVTKVRDGKQVRYYPGGSLGAQLITPPASA